MSETEIPKEASSEKNKLPHKIFVCVTGLISLLLRCKHPSRRQSATSNKKIDILVFWLICSSFLFSLFYVYLWLMVRDNCYLIEKLLFKILGYYSHWYRYLFIVMLLANICVTFIMVLCLLHMVLGQRVSLNLVHWLLLVLVLIFCITITCLIDTYFSQFWAMTYLSFKIFGPFIHILFLTLCTSFSWLFYRYWFKLNSTAELIIWMIIWMFMLAILYLIPIFFHSPKMNSSSWNKPGIIAIGGASNIAPENTLLAFKKAIDLGADGLYITLQFSKDNIPVIMNDNTLTRTTDFHQKFGANASNFIGSYTLKELRTLDAGSWFLDADSCDKASNLSRAKNFKIFTSNILTWKDFLGFISKRLNTKVFVKFSPASPFQIIYKQMADFPMINVSNFYFPSATVLQIKSHAYLENTYRLDSVSKKVTFDTVCMEPNILTEQTIAMFNQMNIITVLKVVNTRWFFSFAWLIGADYVTTHNLDILMDVNFPIHFMDAAVYFTLWITLDLLSMIINSFCFLAQSANVVDEKKPKASASVIQQLLRPVNPQVEVDEKQDEKVILKDTSSSDLSVVFPQEETDEKQDDEMLLKNTSLGDISL